MNQCGSSSIQYSDGAAAVTVSNWPLVSRHSSSSGIRLQSLTLVSKMASPSTWQAFNSSLSLSLCTVQDTGHVMSYCNMRISDSWSCMKKNMKGGGAREHEVDPAERNQAGQNPQCDRAGVCVSV